MQSNDEIYIKDMYEKESEVLPAAFSNVFGVIVLIVPKCYNLLMLPVIPRMFQVNIPVYMLYDAKASYFKPIIPTVDSPVRTLLLLLLLTLFNVEIKILAITQKIAN